MSPSVKTRLVALYRKLEKVLRYAPFLRYLLFGNHIFRPLLRKLRLGELIDQYQRLFVVLSQERTNSHSMLGLLRSLKKEYVFHNKTYHTHYWDKIYVSDDLVHCTPYWLKSKHEQIYFFTVVRNPIERYISQFCHGLSILKFEWNIPFPQLKNRFLAYLDERHHNLNWFDENIKPHLGVDIYAKPFPKCGHDDYEGESKGFQWRWLVLKAELDNSKKADVIKDFIGYQRTDIQFKKINTAGSLQYGEPYFDFRQKLTIPAKYLDKIWGHRYSQHFYSEAERVATYERWLEK